MTKDLLFKFSLILFLLFVSIASEGQRVGLVLSGGGARGMAHIGVIKAMEENNIPIDYISGTSAGAIVASMYAMGLSPEQMDSIVHTDDFFNWANGIIDENYLYYFRKKEENASWISLKFSLDSVITTSLPTSIVSSIPYDYSLMANTAGPIAKANYNFDSLFVPFRCVAADIENKKTVVFKDGDLATAIRASSAYPFYFKPVLYNGSILYDGGMYNNFPADVCLSEFQPDIIIGSKASGTTTPTTEGNIISQIRAMMTTPTNFSVICENGILVESNTDRFGLFDFTRISEIIEEGYVSATKEIEKMKWNISREQGKAELNARRKIYRSSLPEVKIDKLEIEGLNSGQSEYIKNILKPGSEPIPLSRFKSQYFQVVTDPNVKSVYPMLLYNKETGYFDMTLNVKREKDFTTQFGGNISTKPVSMAFVGLQYNIWNKNSYNFSGNFYFGKLYTSGQLKVRLDSPRKFPFFLEAEATVNQYDFFRSSNNSFFTEQKPSYILKNDYLYGLNIGFPSRNKGKIILNGSWITISDDYYQTKDFLSTDTADNTKMRGPTGSALFEVNTLNKKEYANQGTFFSTKLQYVSVTEFTTPGSTSVDKSKKTDYHDWFQLRLTYENYFKRIGRIKFGLYSELVLSNMGFFYNYTSTVLNSPAFTPIQELKTVYIPSLHAHDFAAIGSKNVYSLRNNIDIRLEAYLFQPYQELYETEDKKTVYGEVLADRNYIGSAGIVFHSPIGPIAFMVNYADMRTESFSFLFHFGYFIFNKNAVN
ncbi:MAG TPA: patatin-like phospholipase family protein [Bacteroidia bacterium]|nr:patatin-like phospholipase family protein [Bacteroidota bacterium]HQV99245.1 patatin-like phospholipase family protein [Bacteroidia bacterium]HQW21825.1 patatin-like phospholipase family protein [Bacteroidia bacterium]